MKTFIYINILVINYKIYIFSQTTTETLEIF